MDGLPGYAGWQAIAGKIETEISLKEDYHQRIIIECYHGVLTEEIISGLKEHFKTPITFIPVEAAMLGEGEVDRMVYPFVTDDPVFGYMSPLQMDDFFDPNALKEIRQRIDSIDHGVVCVYGAGASLVSPGTGLLIYADMPRWEIQLRFRNKLISNLGTNGVDQPFSYQYKRAYFVDWRV